VPPWALRLAAAAITALSLLGSTSYALAHPKNPNAPLQPPVAETTTGGLRPPNTVQAPTPVPTLPFRTVTPTTTPPPTTPPPTARATAAGPTPSPTRAPTLRPTPVPQITLQAGVRATALPKITITHVS
jgi:hypothetical protein